jgi:GNAT superfamily N-acetyltransferase
MKIDYEWRSDFNSATLDALHAEGFDRPIGDYDWRRQVVEHSLGWVCARVGRELIGFVNVAWDGGSHAFLLDTLVAPGARHRGVGKRLVEMATREARAAGCEWLHVDFEDHLGSFYFDACGFVSTSAGLIDLTDRGADAAPSSAIT